MNNFFSQDSNSKFIRLNTLIGFAWGVFALFPYTWMNLGYSAVPRLKELFIFPAWLDMQIMVFCYKELIHAQRLPLFMRDIYLDYCQPIGFIFLSPILGALIAFMISRYYLLLTDKI